MRGGFTVLVDEANLRDFALHPSKDAPLRSRTIEKTGCALCRHRGRMTTEQRSELKMVTKIELKNLRVTNLLSALLMNRAVDPNRFGSDDDLKEIGLLTMQFADLEESLALCCEALLNRPELAGFRSPKPVGEKRYSEKLDLFRTLIVAVGVLHSINTDAVETAIGQARQTGERRNNVIHGFLMTKSDAVVVFRNKGNELRADLASLKALNSEILKLTLALVAHFEGFYKHLVAAAPGEPKIEELLIKVLSSAAALFRGRIKISESQAALNEANQSLLVSKEQARASLEDLLRAYRVVLKQLSAEEKGLPEACRPILIELRTQLKRCITAGNREAKTGRDSKAFATARAKVRELAARLIREEQRVFAGDAAGPGSAESSST